MKKIFTLMMCAMTMMVARAQNGIDASQLIIVGETTFDIKQTPSGDWGSTSYDVPVTGIAGLIGVEPSYLQENFASMFYAQTWNAGTESWGDLVCNGNVDVPAGFYYQAGGIVDEVTGEASPVCINTYDWSAAIFFFHKGLYDPAYDIVQISCGQNPGKDGRVGTHIVNNYIVNADKAYVIHFNVIIETPEQKDINDMTKVDEDMWVVDLRDPRKSWDDLDSLELDMDAILAKFSAKMGKEITANDLTLMAINEYDGITDIYTADNDEMSKGFWFDAETGKVCGFNWGVKSYFINWYFNDNKLYLGNMPDAFSGGEEVGTRLFLVAEGTHYYEIVFLMTVAAPEYTFEECELQEMNMVVQLVPSTDGAWEVRRVDVSNIEEMLGAADLKFYGVTADGTITTQYSVSEASQGGGGFWMSPTDDNGFAHADWYSGTGAFAIWYTGAGTFVFFNVPNLPQFGDKAKATFYMANLWNGKAVKLNLTVRYVEEIKEVAPVGEESIEVAGRDETGLYFNEVAFALDQCAAAFDITTDILLESAEMQVIDSDGELTAMTNDEGMFTFNADGELVAADAENAVFQIGMQEDMLRALIISDDDLANTYTAVVYVRYSDSVYAFNVKVKGPKADDADAIGNITSDSADTKIYDISGREISHPTKGLYIKAGKKYMVK